VKNIYIRLSVAAVVVFSVTVLTSCPPPLTQTDGLLHRIEITGIPFVAAPNSSHGATDESIGFLVVNVYGRTGFAVAFGEFPSGLLGPSIENSGVVPGEASIVTDLFAHPVGLPWFEYHNRERPSGSGTFTIDHNPSHAELPPVGHISIFFVPIGNQREVEGQTQPNGQPALPRMEFGQWHSVNFFQEVRSDEDGKHRLVLHWRDLR
jgi:hypothetical protein